MIIDPHLVGDDTFNEMCFPLLICSFFYFRPFASPPFLSTQIFSLIPSTIFATRLFVPFRRYPNNPFSIFFLISPVSCVFSHVFRRGSASSCLSADGDGHFYKCDRRRPSFSVCILSSFSSLRLARSISIFPARTRVYFSSFMCERRLLVGVFSIRVIHVRRWRCGSHRQPDFLQVYILDSQ
jgi:hypothetical protein